MRMLDAVAAPTAATLRSKKIVDEMEYAATALSFMCPKIAVCKQLDAPHIAPWSTTGRATLP